MPRCPAGYHFMPTPMELLRFYLRRKVNGNPLPHGLIEELDPFQSEPWELFDETSWDYFYVFTKMKVRDMQWSQKLVGAGTWVLQDCNEVRDRRGRIMGYDRLFGFFMMTSGAPYHGDWVMRQFSLHEHDYGGDGEAENYVACEFRNIDVDPDSNTDTDIDLDD